jgi:hypothetical protein
LPRVRSPKDSRARRSSRIRNSRWRTGSCGPRTCHRSLPRSKSHRKSTRRILALRSRG